MDGTCLYCLNSSTGAMPCVHHVNPHVFVLALFTCVGTIQYEHRTLWMPLLPPPLAPRPTGFGELIRRMQTADPDRPLHPPMALRSMEDEFHNLAHHIDVCAHRFI